MVSSATSVACLTSRIRLLGDLVTDVGSGACPFARRPFGPPCADFLRGRFSGAFASSAWNAVDRWVSRIERVSVSGLESSK